MSGVLAVVPARGGSKGIPRKNLAEVSGIPLVAHSIRHALASPSIGRVIVSTDDDEIAEVARQFGADVPFRRPPDLSHDMAPTEPVLVHALAWVEDTEKQPVDAVLFLQPTDIFRRDRIVHRVVARLLEDPSLETVFPGFPTHKNYWRRQGDGWVKLAADIKYGPRQTREHLYKEETGIACASRSHVIRSGRRVGDRIDIIPYPEDAVFIDVESEFTAWLADKVMAEWGYKIDA